MSVEIVSGSFRSRIEELLGARCEQVSFAAPFLSRKAVAWLVGLPAAGHGDRRLLLSWVPQSIDSGFLDAHGVDLLSRCGFTIRNLPKLHAKVIVTNSGAYVGSGNLTDHGLSGDNTEIGVFVSSTYAVTVTELFQQWWDAAEPLSAEEIHEAIDRQDRLRKEGKIDLGHEPQPGYQPPLSGGPASSHWIKSQYYRPGGWSIAPGQTHWISDPGIRDKQGRHKKRLNGEWAGKPGYAVGDTIGLYYGTTLKVPVLVEVLKAPEFDPRFVQQHNEGGEPDAGERWPWVTRVRGIARRSLDDAPSIDYLGIRGPILRRKPHFRLSPEQYEKLRHALARVSH